MLLTSNISKEAARPVSNDNVKHKREKYKGRDDY